MVLMKTASVSSAKAGAAVNAAKPAAAPTAERMILPRMRCLRVLMLIEITLRRDGIPVADRPISYRGFLAALLSDSRGGSGRLRFVGDLVPGLGASRRIRILVLVLQLLLQFALFLSGPGGVLRCGGGGCA